MARRSDKGIRLIEVSGESGKFSYRRYNACDFFANELGRDWQDQIIQVGQLESVSKDLGRFPDITREDVECPIMLNRLEGDKTKALLPRFHSFFGGLGQELAREIDPCAVITQDQRKIGVLNIQFSAHQRMVCHVDSNPITVLVFVTTHLAGEGALVVANFKGLASPAEVDEDCTVIQPVAGDVIVFNAQEHSHYSQPISPASLRVVALANYYTDGSPESQRPSELDAFRFSESTPAQLPALD
jgi:hypothetical protein